MAPPQTRPIGGVNVGVWCSDQQSNVLKAQLFEETQPGNDECAKLLLIAYTISVIGLL